VQPCEHHPKPKTYLLACRSRESAESGGVTAPSYADKYKRQQKQAGIGIYYRPPGIGINAGSEN